jgi:hypothetical protein
VTKGVATPAGRPSKYTSIRVRSSGSYVRTRIMGAGRGGEASGALFGHVVAA